MRCEITLTWPSPKLNPNRKRSSHWSEYAGIAKAYKQAAWAATLDVIGRYRFREPPSVEINFYPPDGRGRDDDNMIGAFKAGRDGIALAIRHDDSTWKPSYRFHDPHRPNGRVVVVLAESRA